MDTRRLTLAAGLVAFFASPAAAQQVQWQQLPKMQLERQFAGPLQDTIIQRWRDPADGLVCVVYLPITAQHTPPTASGYVQYGANTIGSISCIAAPSTAVAKTAAVPVTDNTATKNVAANLKPSVQPGATTPVPYMPTAAKR
jgi:hypothetical protein